MSSKEAYVRATFAPIIGVTVNNESGSYQLGPDEILLAVHPFGYEVTTVADFVATFEAVLPDENPPEGSRTIAAAMRSVAGDAGWNRHIDHFVALELID